MPVSVDLDLTARYRARIEERLAPPAPRVFTIERIPVGERDAVYSVLDPAGKTVGAHSLRRDAVKARNALNAEQADLDARHANDVEHGINQCNACDAPVTRPNAPGYCDRCLAEAGQ